MQFGICGNPEVAIIAKNAGYDYFEWSVGSLLHPLEPESVFEDALQLALAAGLPFPAANVFLPGDLKITGPLVDEGALRAYVSTALRRAEKAGLQVIVFGSGTARRIPDGFDHMQGRQQIINFLRWMGPVAEQHGVTIAVEPLNTSESNVITSLEEGAALVREVDHPAIALVVDRYHWATEGDTSEAILANADLIKHAHIATVPGRCPPDSADPCMEFLSTLKQAGYDRRVSIEGNITNPKTELPLALDLMKTIISG